MPSDDSATRTAPAAPAQPARVLVFLATRNESGNIAPLLAAIAGSAAAADVLVVDDGSDDGTVEAIRALAAPRLGLLERRQVRGLGSAHLLAMLHALHHRYEVLVTMDADQSHDPAAIPALLAELDRGADVVVGSRYMRGGSRERDGWRGTLSRVGNRCARTLFGLPLHEYTTSLRAFRVAALRTLDPGRLCVGGHAFFLATIAEAARHRLRLAEVPIHFRARVHGESKMPATEIVRAIVHLVRLAWHVRLARPRAAAHASVPCRACGTAYSVVTARRGGAACLCCGNRER